MLRMKTDGIAADTRDAFRALRRSPGPTSVAILTLALGVGVNATVFSVIESVLVNPLPYADAQRLVSIAQTGATRNGRVSAWMAHQWMVQSTSIATIGLYTDGGLVLTGDGAADLFRGQRVNATFFQTLGVRPLLGRLFTADDDRSPRADVVVLSHELWTSRFGADPSVVGRVYTMDGTPHRVVGVLGSDFHPFRMSNPAEESRIYAPLGYDAADAASCRGCASLSAIGRLADGASVVDARNELTASMVRFRDEHPTDFPRESVVTVEPLKQHLTSALGPALWVALGAAACVLLIACANLAGVQLARSSARASEFALRGALGASRVRVVRQVLLEAAVLGATGCAAGIVLGRVGLGALTAWAPPELPRLVEITMDARVIAFAAFAGLLTAVVAGLAPARDAARADLHDALKHRGHAGAPGIHRGRTALVVSEVALAFVLVMATGLLIRTVSRLLSVDAGFESDHVFTLTPVVTETPAMGAAAMLSEKQRMVDAVSALPGVTAAGLVNDVPLSNTTMLALEIEGRPASAGQPPSRAAVFWVEGNYFSALRIRLRRGRLLTRHDGADAPPAVVVNESFARREFPNGDAIGHRIRLDAAPGSEAWLTIVGVVADVKNVGLDNPADVAVYQPLVMNPFHYVRIVARTDGDPRSIAVPIRAALQQIDPLVPVFHEQPMADYVASSMVQRRFALGLMTLFSGLALALAVIGLYGLLAHQVVLRTTELGIRAALGATNLDLLSLIASRGLALTAAGVAVGATLAIGATRALGSLLFGVSPLDRATFAATAILLAAAGATACCVPALRAGRVDAMRAMREHVS